MMLGRWLLVLCIPTALAVACDTDGGEGDDDDGDSTRFGDSSCRECLTAACSPELGACEGDPECSAFLACLFDCPVAADGGVDQSCAAACPAASSSAGKQAQQAFDGCRNIGAGSSCDSCGDSCGDHPILDQCCDESHQGTDACDTCKEVKCCETRTAINASAEGLAFVDCILACDAAGGMEWWECDLHCADQHPAAIATVAPQLACVTSLCQSECGDGTPPSPCALCMYGDCLEATTNYDGDPDGYLLSRCNFTCGDVPSQSCLDDCAISYPAGMPLWNAQLACIQQKCPGACS